MIHAWLDTLEPTRLLVGLGQTSIGTKWMNRLQSMFAHVMYVNIIRPSDIRSRGCWSL